MQFFSFLIIIPIFILGLPSSTFSKEDYKYEFSPDYFGVSFSPYVKYVIHPPFGGYTMKDVEVMLKVISTRFHKIATYSSGSNGDNLNKTWRDGDANGFIANAAALLNKEAGQKIITMAQGIYQIPESEVAQDSEIKHAFDEIENANSIYPGTVWGVIIYNYYVNNEDDAQYTLSTIRNLKKRAHALNVKIGTRFGKCDHINGGDVQRYIEALAKECDYLMCNIHPSGKNDAAKSPKQAVAEIGEAYWSFATPLKRVNPKLEVLIGDTGWPSQGVSYSGTHNTLRNMKDYWENLNEWAVSNKVNVQVFEAFNEPWKSDLRKDDRKDPSGKYGGEQHFGWFKWISSSRISKESILEKVSELEDEGIAIWVWILIALILVLLICGVIFAIYYLQYKKAYLDKLAEAEIEEFERGNPDALKDGNKNLDSGDLAWNFPYNRDYEISKDKMTIEQSKVLGSGEFGMVYKGKVSDREVAVKTTKPRSSAATLKSLLSEIKTMIYLGRNNNIVEFVGAYTDELRQGIVYVVMEFCPGGSLENRLRQLREQQEKDKAGYENLKPQTLNNEKAMEENRNDDAYKIPPTLQAKLLKWTYEIACGMEFLASKNVIHADLATRNVLLTSNETAKITDFGLSRRLYEYTEYVKKNQEPLPWRWMSPESLHSMTFSSQSDVWSFGITLWEVYSLGDIPYPGLSWTVNFVDQLFIGMKPNCPKYAPTEMYEIMVMCWEIKPENRPKFTALKQRLNLNPEETSL